MYTNIRFSTAFLSCMLEHPNFFLFSVPSLQKKCKFCFVDLSKFFLCNRNVKWDYFLKYWIYDKSNRKLQIKIVIPKLADESIVTVKKIKMNLNCDKIQNFTHYKTQNMTTQKSKLWYY